MPKQPHYVPADARREDLSIVGESVRVLAEASETGSMEAFEQRGPEGAGPPPHSHPWDEAYFMIDGEMEVLLGDRTVVLGPGAFVHIPANTVHCFRYKSRGRFVSMNSRGGASKFFRDLSHAVPAGAPPDMQKMMAACAGNEVTVHLPPAS